MLTLRWSHSTRMPWSTDAPLPPLFPALEPVLREAREARACATCKRVLPNYYYANEKRKSCLECRAALRRKPKSGVCSSCHVVEVSDRYKNGRRKRTCRACRARKRSHERRLARKRSRECIRETIDAKQ